MFKRATFPVTTSPCQRNEHERARNLSGDVEILIFEAGNLPGNFCAVDKLTDQEFRRAFVAEARRLSDPDL
jgi:hypothetical protein